MHCPNKAQLPMRATRLTDSWCIPNKEEAGCKTAVAAAIASRTSQLSGSLLFGQKCRKLMHWKMMEPSYLVPGFCLNPPAELKMLPIVDQRNLAKNCSHVTGISLVLICILQPCRANQLLCTCVCS